MTCKNCNAELSPAALYCPSCGAAEQSATHEQSSGWAIFGGLVAGFVVGLVFFGIFFGLAVSGNGNWLSILAMIAGPVLAVLGLIYQTRLHVPTWVHVFFIITFATMLGMLSLCDLMLVPSLFYKPH